MKRTTHLAVARQASCQLPPAFVDAENVDELLPGAIRQLVDVLGEHLG